MQIQAWFFGTLKTLTQKKIDKRNTHLGNLYQLLGRVDIVSAMVAA